MSKNLFKKTIFLSAVFIGVLFSFSVLAKNKIDVESPRGKNLNQRDIFSEKNIYPGWSKTKKVFVKNANKKSKVKVYINFKVKEGDKLAEVIDVYVRDSKGRYLLGGEGDEMTLKEAGEKGSLYLNKLKPNKRKVYEVEFKFKKEAGNEYQRLESKFDIKFKIKGKVSDGVSGQVTLANQGRRVTGRAPVGDNSNNENSQITVEGEQETTPEITEEATNTEKTGAVAGAKTTCHGWSWWPWLIILAVLLGLATLNDKRNYKKLEYGWKIDALLGAVGIISWYFLDKCRAHYWFLYGLLIIGALIHFVYLKWLRKKENNS